MNRTVNYIRLALRLARRGYGCTSPNPMVGAVLVKRGKIIGRGWHRRAGGPHAEIEALRDAARHGHDPRGATLYVTLEPCSSHGRTPPCTNALIGANIRRVVAAATDPNPRHAGRGFKILRRAGIDVVTGVLGPEAARLNEAFNHWIVHRTPFITVKAAMTLDGKIATASGDSKWITGKAARAEGMKLRQGTDAILVGVNTVLADDPALTRRSQESEVRSQKPVELRRIILDSRARTPMTAKVVTDRLARWTTIVVTKAAPARRVAALAKQVNVWTAPAKSAPKESGGPGRVAKQVDLRWVIGKLGAENVTSLLVEGGGEVNAAFLAGGFAQRIAFFYAPKVLGGRAARKAVAGVGARRKSDALTLGEIEWHPAGDDFQITARVSGVRG